jgi:hypothetical protein
MADETYTKADLDKAIADAVAKVQDSVDKLETKNSELVADLRKARKAGEIKPEDLTAAEERADKAEKALADAQRDLKAANTAAEKATKALEAEQGAARSFAMEAELNGAIAEGNVLPAYVPALKALLAREAKADLVDGKYAVLIGDKPARDHVKSFLESEEGKAFKAAPVNGGGGASGGSGNDKGGKTISRSAFEGMDQAGRAQFAKEGGKVVDEAA